MNRNFKYLIIFIIISFTTLISSFIIFNNGITNKIYGRIKEISYINEDKKIVGNYPRITTVINSSDEKFVNTDVVVLVYAKSNFKIKKLEYSFDMKKWKLFSDKYNSENIKAKMILKKDINKKLYIRVENEKGFKSYAYKTYVKIDKSEPVIKIAKENDSLLIITKDNYKLEKLQYSNDKKEWVDEEIKGKTYKIEKENFEYKFVRSVDSVGNISKIIEVK